MNELGCVGVFIIVGILLFCGLIYLAAKVVDWFSKEAGPW